jgi:hypothetical protein
MILNIYLILSQGLVVVALLAILWFFKTKHIRDSWCHLEAESGS